MNLYDQVLQGFNCELFKLKVFDFVNNILFSAYVMALRCLYVSFLVQISRETYLKTNSL